MILDDPPSKSQLIGVVGPCGSGKSTLIERLEKHGFTCRHIAQEHSYVQAMWQIISKPDILIFLHASFPVSTARRQLNTGQLEQGGCLAYVGTKTAGGASLAAGHIVVRVRLSDG